MNAETFNSRYPVGTPVFAYPGIRPEHPVALAYRKRANDGRSFGDKDPCKRLVTKTRTPAWELGHGAPVVSVDGYAGGIVLDHVDVVSEGEWEAAKTAEEKAGVSKADFFQPGRIYAHDVYRFRCEYIAIHPTYGHRSAWGWFGHEGRGWRHQDFSERQFQVREWTDVTEAEATS